MSFVNEKEEQKKKYFQELNLFNLKEMIFVNKKIIKNCYF
jgi:hypothetical protein